MSKTSLPQPGDGTGEEGEMALNNGLIHGQALLLQDFLIVLDKQSLILIKLVDAMLDFLKVHSIS